LTGRIDTLPHQSEQNADGQSEATCSAPGNHDAFVKALCDHGNLHISRILDARAPRVFIISGPSGVGKDTVIEKLREVYPDAGYVVTATSRPKRRGEVHGKHYLFIDREDFEAQIAAGDFIESALVYGNLYGVPRRPIVDALAAGQHVIIKVDVKGAATLRKLIPNTQSIFLLPESMEALLHRLRARKTEDTDVLMKRFRTATEELDRVEEFDYVVFNEAGRLDAAVRQICNIIDAAQRRVHQPPVILP
jgi:guanylate kinase